MDGRARRVGVVALALLFASVAAALLLAHRYHLGVASTLVAALSGGAPAGLYLAWAAYGDDRQEVDRPGDLALARIADQLAFAVGRQWKAEAAVRRLNDPYPLPVSWVCADAALADGWDLLVKLASSGAGWPAPPPDAWAASAEGLAGSGGELADVLARVPTGRLVVLGEPGAGKTMLMVRLVLDLLARRENGAPVPVLASLATWYPADQDLHSWLAAQLTIDYPALAAAAPATGESVSRIEALLEAGLILPVLDGLDEVSGPARALAITRINDALRPGERLVVTCREEQYRQAIRPPAAPEVTLRATAAVQLQPLDAGDISRYLPDDAGGPVMASRWEPVLAILGSDVPAGQALTTPLMVSLARTIYNRRPGERPVSLGDPAELCSPALSDRAAVERHLLDAFVRAAYRPGTASRWTAQRVERWLVFLARHLENTIGSPDLAWWELRLAMPRAVIGIMLMLTGGVTGGFVAGLVAGCTVGLAAGLADGLMIGITVGVAVWLAGGLPAGSAGGVVVTIAGGIAVRLWDGRWGGLVIGIASCLAVGLAAAAASGSLKGPTTWLGFAVVPAIGLAAWLIIGHAQGLSAGPAAGLAAGLAGGLLSGGAGALLGLWLSNRRWWEITESIETAGRAGLSAGVAGGVIAGLAVSLAGRLVIWVAAGFLVCSAGALLWALPGRLVPGLPSRNPGLFAFWERRRISLKDFTGQAVRPSRGLRLAFFRSLFGEPDEQDHDEIWLVLTLAAWAGLPVGVGVGFLAGAVAGLITGIGTALVVAAENTSSVTGSFTDTVNPKTALTRDRQAAIGQCCVNALGYALLFGFAAGFVGGLPAGLITGLIAGLMIGLRKSMTETAWPSYILARGWLVRRHRLPWHLWDFFADAHQRGILRQAGAAYQFRHIELQHRLAARP